MSLDEEFTRAVLGRAQRIARKRGHSIAVWGIFEVRRPISRELIGYRIKVANLTLEKDMFAPRLLVAESSDYTFSDEAEAASKAFLANVAKFHGYTRLIQV